MKFLIRTFLKYREVFAVLMFFCGLPIVYFFRDGLKLAPNSAIFTIAGGLGPLFLAVIFKNISKLYKPNTVGYLITLAYVIICLLYLLFRDPYSRVSVVYEMFSFSFIFFIYFAFATISLEQINRNFLPIALTICVIGSLLLVYSVYKDPFYVLGQRASIKFRSEAEGNTGNPHTYSKVAFFGVIVSMLFLKYQSRYKVGIIPILSSFFIFLIVLFLTQTMITFITTALFLFLFLIFNLKVGNIYRSFLKLFLKWYVLAILVFGIYKGVDYLKKHEDVFTPITSFISKRFEKITNTFISGAAGSKGKNDSKSDQSANMRVQLINEVFVNMEENFEEGRIRYILFGNGYKNLYVDVPIFEALDSFGFFMFIFYMFLYFYMTVICIKEMRKPRSIATEFIAYGFIYFFIQNLTGGLLMDFNRWAYYAAVCRFIPATYFQTIGTKLAL